MMYNNHNINSEWMKRNVKPCLLWNEIWQQNLKQHDRIKEYNKNVPICTLESFTVQVSVCGKRKSNLSLKQSSQDPTLFMIDQFDYKKNTEEHESITNSKTSLKMPHNLLLHDFYSISVRSLNIGLASKDIARSRTILRRTGWSRISSWGRGG